MSYGRGNNECRIYVGNLPPDIRTKDIEDLFYKFGKIVFIDLKNRRGPPFAFVEFEDPRLVVPSMHGGCLDLHYVVLGSEGCKDELLDAVLMSVRVPVSVLVRVVAWPWRGGAAALSHDAPDTA